MVKPESPLDLACEALRRPAPVCGARAGEPCIETVGSAANPVVRARAKPHLARVHRYERACADWERLEKLRANSST